MNFVRRTLCTLLALLLSALTPALGQSIQPKVIPTGNWPVSTQSADLNGDGKPDLLYIDYAPAGQHSTLHFLLNNGNGVFVPSPSAIGLLQAGTAGMGGASVYAVGDFRGSGHPDIVTFVDITPGSNELQIFSNVGDGTFVPSGHLSLLAGYNPPAVPRWIQAAAARLTTTGPPGFIAEDDNNGQIIVTRNDGTGNFTLQSTISLASTGVGPFVITDLNNDGFTDIVLRGNAAHGLTIFYGRGDGTFTPATSYTLPTGIFSMLVADIDGDAIPDLVVEGANGALSYFPGTPTGFATTAIAISGAQDGTIGQGGHLIAIADLNGDHIPDIITSTPAGISVLLGQGALTYTLLGIYNAGPGRGSYTTADFNDDGHLDLALDSPEGIAILYGNADGSFETSKSYAAGLPADSVSLGRFTASGNTDALVANGTPELFEGDGKGGFTLGPPLANPYKVDLGPWGWWSLALGDFNADTRLDALFLPTGAPPSFPTFVEPPNSGVIGVSYYPTFGDLDNGDGTGAFPDIETLSGLPSQGTVAVGDLNGDGFSDLATFSPGGCSVFMTALPPETVVAVDPVGGAYNTGAIGFLKTGRTNKEDLVCQNSTTLSVSRNNGDGTFTQTATLPAPSTVASADTFGYFPATGLFPSAVQLADLDNDGNGDIIVVYHNLASDPAHPSTATPNQVYIYWGNGDGTFSAPLIQTTSRNYYQAAIADMDGDGKPDLVLSDGYLLSVFPNTGNRTFGAEQHFLAGMGINAIASATINSKTALVVANGGAVFSNPAANRGILPLNAEINTGGITVLAALAHTATSTPTGTIFANPEPSAFGMDFTLTAILTPGATGSITFSFNGTVLGTSQIINGVAKFPVTAPTYLPGTYTVTAAYSGDPLFNPATLTGSHVISGATSQTTITNLVSPIYYGQTIAKNAQASVTPIASAVGGTLTIYIDRINVCVLQVTTSTMTCPASTGSGYSVGTHTISASYSGNDTLAASDSPIYPVVILPDDTQGILSSSLNPAPAAQAVTFTAVFTAPFATPTGTVTFLDGITPIGTAQLDATGTASLTVSNLTIGTHPITASYAATNNFNSSTTPPVQQVIGSSIPGSFTLTVTPTTVPVPIGSSVSVSVAINALNGFSQPVALACTGLPREATCVFDNPTISAGGGTTRLNLSASAPHDCNNSTPYFITPAGPTTWLGLIATGGLLLLIRRRRRLVKALILVLALCILPALSTGCGNCTDLGVEPRTYTFTVTATSTGTPSTTASQTIKMVAHL